jgi:hypothetical protein
MFSFTFSPNHEEYASGHHIVQISGLNADANLPQVVSLFSDFLRGIGYVFEEIEVVSGKESE